MRALQRSLEIFDNASELDIDRLEPRDVSALIDRVEELHDAGGDLASKLYAQSEGNTFFLTAAIETAIERGVSEAETVSKSVAQLIDGRLDSLSAEARNVAELAAVAVWASPSLSSAKFRTRRPPRFRADSTNCSNDASSARPARART